MTVNRLFGLVCINAALTAVVASLFLLDHSWPITGEPLQMPPDQLKAAHQAFVDLARRRGCDDSVLLIIRKDTFSSLQAERTARTFESQYRKMGWNFVFMAGAMSLITLTAGILLLRTPGAKPE